MGKKHINVGLFTSAYSYFLYLLLKGYNKDDFIIVHASFPKEISKNIHPTTMPFVAFKYGAKMAPTNSLKGILENIVGYLRYFYGYIKLRILFFIKTFHKEVEIYGHAQSPFSFMFYEHENSNIIEDGLANYTKDIQETHEINPIIDKLLHICGIYFLNANEALGSHKNIKNIYLTNEFNHPLIKDKIKIINIEQSWNKLSKREQKEILNIFNVKIEKINFKGKTALILTQPFYEDGISTLDEEITIYEEFINKFKDYNIIIKPHPRDSKDYKKIFPKVNIIDKHFPIELITLIGIKPTIACSIVSTAILNFKDSEIYIYEGELKNKRMDNARNDLIKLINNQCQ